MISQAPIDPMSAILQTLSERLAERGVPILLGGGYGLYLKQIQLMTSPGSRTILPGDKWPIPRSTSDLDLFFAVEVISNLEQMQQVRIALDELGFTPIDSAKYWQFIHKDSGIKIDLLSGPITERYLEFVQIRDGRRVRPKGDVKLHARLTSEALELGCHTETITIGGVNGSIQIPGPFSYLMMKLTAFSDQVSNSEKDEGRHHALDIYRVVAMMNESQFEDTLQSAMRCSEESHFRNAQIV